MLTNEQPLLLVRDVKVHFPVDKGLWSQLRGQRQTVFAVDGVDLELCQGQTMGLVGESGCGKTTLAKAILRLYEPTSGSIFFAGRDIAHLAQRQLLSVRRRLQMVFQNPQSSLNRRQTVGHILMRPLQIHKVGTRQRREEIADQALEAVGLQSAFKNRYPHEFSGGQRQRIGIARALVLNPEIIVLDEPVSALDVSIQAQILNLLMELQERNQFAYLLIAHDLSVVRRISDRVGVMYLGRIVEQGMSGLVLGQPLHPYTQALRSAVPGQVRKQERLVLQGGVPSPINPPSGCRFHPRCPYAKAICKQVVPRLQEIEPRHQVACHLFSQTDCTC